MSVGLFRETDVGRSANEGEKRDTIVGKVEYDVSHHFILVCTMIEALLEAKSVKV